MAYHTDISIEPWVSQNHGKYEKLERLILVSCGWYQPQDTSIDISHYFHISVAVCLWFCHHNIHYCLLDRLFRPRSKKTSKLRITGLCVRNSPVTGDFPPERPVMRKMFPDDLIMQQKLFYKAPSGQWTSTTKRCALLHHIFSTQSGNKHYLTSVQF